ncbi:hypothetical protein G5B40_12825 [Pikeienuella piscinae]|uniref:Glyoxalase-related protein domain-containing protein n=2 Tax=Pikeienuella piscinae TaxID=2748098 RepID=A0A7L5C1A8_9RHOB|nr:hypothetical protein G5B40_12825 [Pikeienuella piscinae]
MMLSIEDLKAQAKRLRATLAESGQTLGHSQSLEAVARMRGYRDWNTLHAAIGNRPPGPPVGVGQSVGGAYLGKPFRGEVKAVSALGDGRFRITLHFDDPVDVSTFESFEVLRQRVSATIQRNGETMERTSNGAPQMQISL